MTATAEDVLRRAQAAADAGELLGIELEWYVSGGLPPPRTRSDQLRLRVEDGREAIVFAKERWDTAFDPPNVHDKWDLPLDADTVRRVLRAVLDGRVFATRYPEEERPNARDVLWYEALLGWNGTTLTRRYWKTLPEPVLPLAAICDELVDRAVTSGRKRLFHRGVEVRVSP